MVGMYGYIVASRPSDGLLLWQEGLRPVSSCLGVTVCNDIPSIYFLYLYLDRTFAAFTDQPPACD
jgi:hypothetical protein